MWSALITDTTLVRVKDSDLTYRALLLCSSKNEKQHSNTSTGKVALIIEHCCCALAP